MTDDHCLAAVPLQNAMERWLPAELLGRVAAAFRDLEKHGRRVYRIDAAGCRHAEVDWTSDHNRPLIAAVREAQAAAEAAFLGMLRRGDLVAWARAGSPLAPLRRVPAEAWTVLRLTHVAEGRASGAGVALFGLRVAEARAEPPAAPPAERPAERAPDAALAWMREHAPGLKREAAIADCQRAIGVTYRQARDAWSALPPEVRGTRGARKRP